MTGMTGGSFLPWLTLLRDLSLKSALLLLVAWALTLGMRRASAAARHLVWLLTFAGLLLLPLLSLTLPPRPVAVLPAAPPEDRPLAPNNGGTGKNSEKKGAAREEGAASSAPTSPPAPPLVGAGGAISKRQPDWPAVPAVLCLLWLAGVLLASFPLGLGWIGAVRRIRRCAPVSDPALLAVAAEAGCQLGVRRSISLRSGPFVAVPVTFGLRRPVILLPEEAASWPAERLRVALLHETAHVRRGDWAVQTLARLVCALFWHNPLVWPAARMLRAEAERACDDRVLALGIPAPDYAQHLLAVAGALSGANRPLPLAVPMAGQTALESRLRAVLIARPRRAPSRRVAALALVLALVVLVPLAALRPAARAARRAAPPSLASALLPASPEAARPSPAPVRASVTAAPTPIPISLLPTPKGVPPMKPPMPVRTVALAALAAGLALPAAQAKPIAPVKHVPLSAVALPHMRLQAAPPPNGSTPINFATQGDVANGVGMLFQGSHRNYVIEPGVSGTVNVHLNGLPFDKALNTLVSASSQPLAWSIEDGVYHIRPRALHAGEVRYSLPRQVQLKFEWASSASASGAAPDKTVDALTIIAEEGRKAQASSQHLRNGVGSQETITVVARLEAGGMVSLNITEHSDTTARVGDTKSGSAETTVRVKDGETGTVRVQVSKQGGQSAERILFVTPTIIRSAE